MAKVLYKNGITSVILRMRLLDSASTSGAGKTGLTSATSGLSIATIADNESVATVYTSGSPSTIDSISTLGTFAAPTTGHCRFKEVDSTNLPGLYEIQLSDARFAVVTGSPATNFARTLIVSVICTGVAPEFAEIQLARIDVNDIVRAGMTSLPNGPLEFKKNAAHPAFMFAMYNSAGALVSGATITAQRSLDGASYASCANAAAEIGSTGTYKIDLNATDTNGDMIAFLLTATSCVPTFIVIKTQP